MDNKTYPKNLASVAKAFEKNEGFFIREVKGKNNVSFVVFIKEITDRADIAKNIITPLKALSSPSDVPLLINSPSVTETADIKETVKNLCAGCTLVFCGNRCFSVATQRSENRGVTEPTSDVTVKGPKAGFIEDADANISMLRKYIKTPALKTESFTVGEISKTKVTVLYVEGRADNAVIAEIKNRLSNAKADVITDSGNISMLLTGKKYNFLPICGSTEKVDKAASKIMSGRVAVVVDGSPFVLTLPYVFAECLQASDDYLHTFLYATFIRLLRLIAFLISVFAPAVLCAAVNKNGAFLPERFYGMIDKSRADIPISFFWEIISVLLLFELLREVGVRMPRTVGDAVGIVGSIILGNTAVDAGIVSSVGVITVALAAVCSFITPAYMYVVVLARILVLVIAELFGFWGIIACAVFFFLSLAFKKSFGVPYLTPLIPPNKKGLMDFIFADPKKTLGKREELRKK